MMKVMLKIGKDRGRFWGTGCAAAALLIRARGNFAIYTLIK